MRAKQMAMIIIKHFRLIFVFLMALLPTVISAQQIPEGLLYEIDGRSISITGYIGSATSVYIPAAIDGLPVTTIEMIAFSGCRGLTSIAIPSSVTTIGMYAFSDCSLTSVTIPASVTTMQKAVFSDCSLLTNISVDPGNRSYTSVGGVLFDKSVQTLIGYPAGKGGAYTIPSSVTSIEREAFRGCSNLTSVDIPQSVSAISRPLGYNAFFGCNSLTNINVASQNSMYASVDGVLFDKSRRTLICYPEGKSGAYSIPSSVNMIEEGAFADCTRLASITIPSSVTTIEGRSFAQCSSLKSVTIPSSVTKIGIAAFHGCSRLTNVNIPLSVTTIDAHAFYETNLTDVTLSRRTKVEKDAFDTGVRIQYRD